LRTHALLLCAALVAAGCQGASSDPGANTLTEEYRAALADSVSRFAGDIIAAISGHDVDRFMAAHLDSPELTYAAAGRIYPAKDTLYDELRTYFASPAAKHVTFSLAEPKVNILDADAAVVTARINSMNRDSVGNVRRGHQAWSIVLVRRGDGWKIIQAHESYPRAPAADSTPG
jgi:ketosteroid isomerase-like protein